MHWQTTSSRFTQDDWEAERTRTLPHQCSGGHRRTVMRCTVRPNLLMKLPPLSQTQCGGASAAEPKPAGRQRPREGHYQERNQTMTTPFMDNRQDRHQVMVSQGQEVEGQTRSPPKEGPRATDLPTSGLHQRLASSASTRRRGRLGPTRWQALRTAASKRQFGTQHRVSWLRTPARPPFRGDAPAAEPHMVYLQFRQAQGGGASAVDHRFEPPAAQTTTSPASRP